MCLSLYIHVPFCLKKCGYCDFVSMPLGEAGKRACAVADAAVADAAVAAYLVALEREMRLVGADCSASPGTVEPVKPSLKTLFLGGGTPTVLPSGKLVDILQKTREYFTWERGIEVTTEANPGTTDREILSALYGAGVNRLSIGAQAFQDHLLQTLGRVHTAEEIAAAVHNAREAGFENVGLDLMYGLPGQTLSDWIESLDRAVNLGVEHISAYSLQWEPGTKFEQARQEGRLVPCDQDLEADMFGEAISRLTAAGFRHYELSNFALPGRECRHNLTYWRLEEYLGLGPAAHSLVGGCRLANTPDLAEYISLLNFGRLPVVDKSVLTGEAAMSEFMFLGLRLLRGVSEARFRERFGVGLEDIYGDVLERLAGLNLLVRTPERVALSERGLWLANEVFEAFV